MTLPGKTVALIGTLCLTGGWLVASIVAPPVARVQTRPEPRVARPAPPPVFENFSEELAIRLRAAPSAPAPRRNPFAFGERRRTDERVTPPATSVAVEMPPPIPVPSGPSLTLAGLAETASPHGPVRTAVLSDGTTVHLVRTGDVVHGYTVREIHDDRVLLTDDKGGEVVLQLR